MVVELTAKEVWRLLEGVPDPEIPSVSICDLGIVRDVDVESTPIRITLTPTYAACPATDVIQASVREALSRAGIDKVTLDLRLLPTWSSDWLTAQGKAALLREGIAPPVQLGGEVRASVVRFMPKMPPCPRCHSKTTTRLSEFGATACKALYRCESCREPFEYFKPI